MENYLLLKHVCLANFINNFEVIFVISGLYITKGFIFLSFFLFIFLQIRTHATGLPSQSMVSGQLATRKEPNPLGSWQLLEFRLTPLNRNGDSKCSWCWDASMGNTSSVYSFCCINTNYWVFYEPDRLKQQAGSISRSCRQSEDRYVIHKISSPFCVSGQLSFKSILGS